MGSGWIWDDLGLREPGAPVEVKLDVRCFRVLKGLRGWGCQSGCGGSTVTEVWRRGLWRNPLKGMFKVWGRLGEHLQRCQEAYGAERN